jgi:hypothetical protein
MPLLHGPNPAENFYTQEAESVAPVHPVVGAELIENHLDTASVFMDLQGGSDFILSLSGSPLTTTYYSTISRSDDLVINSHDVDDRTVKQYRRINKYEIRVTSAPEMSVDDSTNTATVTGQANVYPIVTPKVGDVFVQPIVSADGIYGTFQVTDVKRLSMYANSAWAITYSQIRYSHSELDEKSEPFVVMELDFLVSNLELGKNPLIPIDTNLLQQDCRVVRQELIELYYNAFYDKEVGTFLVPVTNKSKVYDPFILKFWNTIVDSSMYTGRTSPTEYPINTSVLARNFITVFDIYLEQSIGKLQTALKYFTNLSTSMFSAPYLKLTIFASGIHFVVYPPTTDDLELKPIFVSPIVPNSTPYIFSEDFYSGESSVLLEKLILSVIKRKTILLKDVFTALELVKTDTRLNQFYQLPFIISLLQVAR